MNPVGYIVGEVSTNEFTFVTNRDIAPPRLGYKLLLKWKNPVAPSMCSRKSHR